jgi:hypothetical protein
MPGILRGQRSTYSSLLGKINRAAQRISSTEQELLPNGQGKESTGSK